MSKEESFISHLVELRSRLVKAVAAIIIVFIILCIYPRPETLYNFLAKPLLQTLPVDSKLIAVNVIDPFMTPIKVTLLTAFLLALPYVLYQVWAFVAPGLYQNEKRIVIPLVFSTTALFIGGIAFAYFVVFGVVFQFLVSVAPTTVAVAPDIAAYLDFVMTMFLAFGITFQVPVVVVVLVRMGVLTIEQLQAARGYVIVGAFVIAAVVTPPDVFSQILLAVPLCLLYELGVLVARIMIRKRTVASSITDVE